MCATRRLFGGRLFKPVKPKFAPRQPRPTGITRLHLSATDQGRRRSTTRPRLESLESRVNLSTFIWTALGDGQTWNDANNWYQVGVSNPLQQPTVPTPYSDVIFPPTTTLPGTSSTTIDFDFAYLYMPLNSLTIEDPYTFTGNPITIESSLSTANSFSPTPGATPAVITLAGLKLAPGAVINSATGSSLQLGSTTSSTALQLTVQGPLTKSGGGQLAIDTQSVFYANSTTVQPIPLTIAGGSIALGDTVNLSGVNVQINSTAALLIADDVAAKVQGLTGTGLVDLEGTTDAGDSTSLTVAVPNATTDQFGGFIDGIGQFIAGGNGTLSTRTIDFGGAGSIQVLSGTLDVDGSISADTLDVSAIGTLGGLGLWSFSGPAVFESGSTFDVTLNGTSPGTQYTQLVDTDTTAGVSLGNSTLAASVGYEYEQGDQYTIIVSPVIQGVFQNVVAGRVTVNGTVPMGVSYAGTAVTMTPLQSVTTTGLQSSTTRSNPGVPVTFTASVSTRTTPVSTGTVSFMQGSAVLATVALGSGGTASVSTTSLPLGSTAVTAVFSGAGGNLGSLSPTLSVSVVPYSTATIVAGSPNPSTLGRPVTFTASVVTTTGAAVTSGTVSFRQGKLLLGTVPVSSAGTAALTTSSLAVGKAGIQAIYSGAVDDFGSASAVFKQTVGASPTLTSLLITTQTMADGRTKYLLIATVTADGDTALTPTGTVVFKKNGHSLGSARLKGGVARLVLGRKAPGSGARFVASFQKNTRFRASRSLPVEYLS
jgi:Bacterial Ig-like domain (group 3)